ncbi:MAG: glycosyltransferase family 1 protein [Caulobacterales bacterium]|nr:glycosyltransferase family 1 protein [Caulobacterales bacterium]
MHILVSSVGTRGDVQPALALGVEFKTLGHAVRFCVPPNFVAQAQDLGFEARPIGVEMRAPKPGEPPSPIPDLIADQFASVAAASEGCDLLVGAGTHQYALRSVAELRSVPSVIAAYAPVSLPSPELAPPGPPVEDIDAAWAQTRAQWNQRALGRVNANRERLGLAAVEDVLGHILGHEPWLAADPVLGPAPAAPGMSVVQTGAWLPRDTSPLPAEVEAFLESGEAPIYLGFGSMPAAAALGAVLIEAVRAAGRRAILSRGWAELALDGPADDVLPVGDVNHQALFPRVAAVVHHGGAGTTTTAALAGAPQVITPMFTDQFYWGDRIAALGAGATTPFTSLTAESLTEALNHALTPTTADAARALSGKVTADGAAQAARLLIERFA